MPYKKLSTAYLFRTKYDAQCKCQPHPWEEASRDRHRLYALEAAKLKGTNKVASKDIEALKDKLEKAEKIARVEATKQQESLAAQAHLAKLATAKKKSSQPVAETAKTPAVTAVAPEAPSPLDPAFRTGKIRAGAQAADLMGPPAPATFAAAPVAKVAAASTSGAPRSDALKGAVILRLGASAAAASPPRSQKSVITFPPIINRRPPPISGENWRKSAFQPSG